MYKAFLARYRLKETCRDNEQESFLHRRRMIAFIDRRSAAKGGHTSYDAWLYEPPKDCNEIPDNAVPEWFINASRTTLLPQLGYRVQSELSQDERAAFAMKNHSAELEAEAMATKQNVSSSFHCVGSLLTLSFYVKSADVVKCYIFWHDLGIRFMPEDIRTTLLRIFDLERHGNREFLQNDEILAGFIESMRRGLRDEEFKAFQMSSPVAKFHK